MIMIMIVIAIWYHFTGIRRQNVHNLDLDLKLGQGQM